MNANTEKIAEDLLKLPMTDRIEIAERLIASVDSFATPEIEAEWRQAVAERVEEYERNPAGGIPAEEVHRSVREKLNEIRKISS